MHFLFMSRLTMYYVLLLEPNGSQLSEPGYYMQRIISEFLFFFFFGFSAFSIFGPFCRPNKCVFRCTVISLLSIETGKPVLNDGIYLMFPVVKHFLAVFSCKGKPVTDHDEPAAFFVTDDDWYVCCSPFNSLSVTIA